MFKVILIAAKLFLFVSSSSAQTNPYVEVLVSDTMQLDPDEIIYAVKYSHWSPAIDTLPTVAFDLDPTMAVLQEVRQIIQAIKLDTIKTENYEVSPDRSYEGPVIFIRFKSMDKLQEFTSRIEKLERIKGWVRSMLMTQENAAEKILFRRLFNQAKAKAEVLAQIAGKKLGNVVFVKEQPTEGGWTMYPPLSALDEHYSQQKVSQNGKITLYRNLLVQFNWHNENLRN